MISLLEWVECGNQSNNVLERDQDPSPKDSDRVKYFGGVLHGCGPSSGLFCANSNQVSKAPKMLTELTEERTRFPNPSTSAFLPSRASQSFVVTSPSPKHNHVGTGYVLGSSAHLEVCLAVPRTPSLALILIQSRTLALSAFTLSIAVYTGMLPGNYVIWYTPYIWQFPPQIWRLVTSFLITGKDLSIIFDTYFCMPHFTACQQSLTFQQCTHMGASLRPLPQGSRSQEIS